MPTNDPKMSNAAAERIRALSAELREAKRLLAEKETALAAAGTGAEDATKLKADNDRLKGELKAGQEGWAMERAILGAGITDADGIEFTRVAYNRLPTENRPELGSWLKNRDALPKAVQAYLPTATPATPATPETPAAPGTTPAAPATPGTPAAPAAAATPPATPAAPATPRPGWTPATPKPVPVGGANTWSDRIKGATSLEDLAKVQSERIAARRA